MEYKERCNELISRFSEDYNYPVRLKETKVLGMEFFEVYHGDYLVFWCKKDYTELYLTLLAFHAGIVAGYHILADKPLPY